MSTRNTANNNPRDWERGIHLLPEFIRDKLLAIAKHEADTYITRVKNMGRNISGYTAVRSGVMAYLWSIPWHAMNEAERSKILMLPNTLMEFKAGVKTIIEKRPKDAVFVMPRRRSTPFEDYYQMVEEVLNRYPMPARIGLHSDYLETVTEKYNDALQTSKKNTISVNPINALIDLLKNYQFPLNSVVFSSPQEFYDHTICRGCKIVCHGAPQKIFENKFKPIKGVPVPHEIRNRLSVMRP